MTTDPHPPALDVVVVGAGQAGLAVAYHLVRQGAHFLVLEAGDQIGQAWRDRWDSLRLFTPAEYDGLPGMAFPASDGEYPTKDMVADYLRDYAARFELPIRLGCAVSRVEEVPDGFQVHTSRGALAARQVVIATGPFQVPVVPTLAADLPGDVLGLHSADYRGPGDIPAGTVVVVGAGNSGRQIAEELAATHDVVLAVGTSENDKPIWPHCAALIWPHPRVG